MTRRKKIGKTPLKILRALEEAPDGLDIKQLRQLIATPEEPQQHLDRRLRQLDPHYIIERSREGVRTIYTLVGPRPEGEWEYGIISKDLRAVVLNKAIGRCQMCGRTIAEDHIKLQIDHKIPQEWGGKTERDNLWAICGPCNEGKKNYFSTFDTKVMKTVLTHKSVHKRIAELLRQKKDEWVDSDLIEFVANALSQQTDWRKRLRELRYLGLEIDTRRKKLDRRTMSQYMLTKWVPLPTDPTRATRQFEKKRAERNKG